MASINYLELAFNCCTVAKWGVIKETGVKNLIDSSLNDDEFIKITTLLELPEKQENMNSEEKLSAIKQTAQEIIYLVDKAIVVNFS